MNFNFITNNRITQLLRSFATSISTSIQKRFGCKVIKVSQTSVKLKLFKLGDVQPQRERPPLGALLSSCTSIKLDSQDNHHQVKNLQSYAINNIEPGKLAIKNNDLFGELKSRVAEKNNNCAQIENKEGQVAPQKILDEITEPQKHHLPDAPKREEAQLASAAMSSNVKPAIADIKLDGKGIPVPPSPPPLPNINNASRLVIQKKSASNNIKSDMGSDAFLSELKLKLEKRNNNNVSTENNVKGEAYLKVLSEIAELRKQDELDAPKRAAVEAKEDAKALEAQAKLSLEAKTPKAEMSIGIIKLDAEGIPVPPPPPPLLNLQEASRLVISKRTVSDNTDVAMQQKDMMNELTSTLRKRNKNIILTENKTEGASPKFLADMTEAKKQSALETPKLADADAEAKKQVRFANMIRVEGKWVPEIKLKAEINIATPKLDNSSIPVPPSPPLESTRM